MSWVCRISPLDKSKKKKKKKGTIDSQMLSDELLQAWREGNTPISQLLTPLYRYRYLKLSELDYLLPSN